MSLLSGSIPTRHRPPVNVSSSVIVISLGAMPAVCCAAWQAPSPLDAGRRPGLAGRRTAHTTQRVRCAPSVDGDPRCPVAYIGLLGPQLPPFSLLRLCLRDG